MQISYNPAAWYWVGQLGLYSSAAGALIQATDPDYVAWKANGGAATPWPKDESGAVTVASLDEVLVSAGLPPTGLGAPTKPLLLAYANAKQWALATGGYTVTVNGASIVFPTDPVSMGLITGKAARLAQPNPPASFVWQTPTGFVTIAATAFDAVATQIADFVQSTFDALAVVFAAIEAGTITTAEAIDAASWPSNVSTTPA